MRKDDLTELVEIDELQVEDLARPAQSDPADSEAPKPVVKRRRNWRSSLTLLSLRLLLLAAIIGLWQLTVNLKLFDRTATSSPHDVFTWLWHGIQTETLWRNLGYTLEAAMIAFVLASVVGITVGIALALLPRVEKVVDPFLSALNATPRIALAPVFIVAFGLTINAKVALAFTIVVFIVLTSARAGVRSVDVEHLRLARVLGASRIQMFTKILFPVAVPAIFGGLRLGVIYALLGTLTAELLGSNNGIGQQLQSAAGLFDIGQIYGLVIVIAISATLINLGMGYLERYLLRWQAPQQ
jgi:NitT/TauT family transport system permease protein